MKFIIQPTTIYTTPRANDCVKILLSCHEVHLAEYSHLLECLEYGDNVYDDSDGLYYNTYYAKFIANLNNTYHEIIVHRGVRTHLSKDSVQFELVEILNINDFSCISKICQDFDNYFKLSLIK